MIVTLFELGVWASYKVTKFTVNSIYSAARYALYGYVPTKEELEKQELMDRIGYLEEKVHDLEIKDVPSSGVVDEDIRVRPDLQTTIRYEHVENREIVGCGNRGPAYKGTTIL